MEKKICKGKTKKNETCKKKIQNDEEYCYLHIKKYKNINKKDNNMLLRFPNEIINNIYEFLNLQSAINFSRTNKLYHKIFKSKAYNINMEDIMILMLKNRFKTKNNDFKSIFHLFLYYIRQKGINVKGDFELAYPDYHFYIIVNNSTIKIDIHYYGIIPIIIKDNNKELFIKDNKYELGYIDADKYNINDILNMINIIYDYMNNNKEYDINVILEKIKKNINVYDWKQHYKKGYGKDLDIRIKEETLQNRSCYYFTKNKYN